jgi:hypothetical protein
MFAQFQNPIYCNSMIPSLFPGVPGLHLNLFGTRASRAAKVQNNQEVVVNVEPAGEARVPNKLRCSPGTPGKSDGIIELQ